MATVIKCDECGADALQGQRGRRACDWKGFEVAVYAMKKREQADLCSACMVQSLEALIESIDQEASGASFTSAYSQQEAPPAGST